MTYKSKVLAECSMSIALAAVLSFIPLFKFHSGGSVTLACTAPLIIFSFKRGFKWGAISGFIYSLFQLLSGFHFPPSKTIFSFICVIFLDYVFSYSCIGLCSSARLYFKNKYFQIALAVTIPFIVRLICSTVSGMIVWKDYFPQDVPVVVYSFIYNFSYLLPEFLITALVCFFVIKHLYKNNLY